MTALKPGLIAIRVTLAVSVLATVAAGAYGGLASDSDLSDRMKFEQRVSLFGADEFTGPRNSPPNPKYWTFEDGRSNGSVGPQTINYRPENSRLDGDGHLILEARMEQEAVTSARLNTLGKIDFEFGLIEARIKMPEGRGIQPAFSMMGSSSPRIGYPESGRIDILELVDGATTGLSAIHGPWIDSSQRPESSWDVSRTLDAGVDLTEDFHIYWIARESGSITIGIDDDVLATYRKDDLPQGARWVMDEPFFVVLDLAVSDSHTAGVDAVSLPATMTVDWLRVYG